MSIQERLLPGKYRLRVGDYERLAEADVFGDQRTELIEGDVIVMAPEYRPNAYVRDELAYRLRLALEALGSPLHASSGSVALTESTMPQPDIVLTREPRGTGAIPLHSVALLVEVSSTTLSTDLGIKRDIYASAGIAEYWVVDIHAGVIHQMSEPVDTAYKKASQVTLGSKIKSVTIKGLTIITAAL